MQVLTWCDGVGVAPDDPRLNPYGGAIACGHPLAATGVRLIAQLAVRVRAAAGRAVRPHGALHRARDGRGAPLGEPAPWLASPSRGSISSGLETRVGPSRSSRSTTAPTGASRTRSARRRSLARRRPRRAPTRATGAVSSSPASRSSSRPAPTSPSSRASRPSGPGRAARAGHELFGRLRELPFPTLAAVNGAALGGGLELALHCDVRTLAANVRHLAFPEVFLGLFPAWGGTQLVPRLVGAEAAVKLIVDNPLQQNRMIGADGGARARARRPCARAGRVPRRVARAARSGRRGRRRQARPGGRSERRRRGRAQGARHASTTSSTGRHPRPTGRSS